MNISIFKTSAWERAETEWVWNVKCWQELEFWSLLTSLTERVRAGWDPVPSVMMGTLPAPRSFRQDHHNSRHDGRVPEVPPGDDSPRCPGPKCWEFVHWTRSRSQLLWCLSLTSLQYLPADPLNVYSSSSWPPETLMTVSGGQELLERDPPLSILPTAEAPAVLIPFTGRNPLPSTWPVEWC